MEREHLCNENHSLTLGEGGGGKCSGCREEIGEATCYCCSEGCEFFLHKSCGERPWEITRHPMHPRHPLHLTVEPNRPETICNGCDKEITGFSYNCASCEFDLDMTCAFPVRRECDDRAIHHHPLTFHPRSVRFECDACGHEDWDRSYQCGSCMFWIHEKCASLPKIARRDDHKHDYSLHYCVPEERRIYRFSCGVCEKRIEPLYWVYHCYPCRYFVHIRCIKAAKVQHQDCIDADGEMVEFPTYDKSVELIARFLHGKKLPRKIEEPKHLFSTSQQREIQDILWVEGLSTERLKLYYSARQLDVLQNCFTAGKHKQLLSLDSHIASDKDILALTREIKHFSHKQHPLILFLEEINDNEEILCDGCIEPVTSPYYCCQECSYFLHLSCAKLPFLIEHPLHPHRLHLTLQNRYFDLITCTHCNLPCNGFFYTCTVPTDSCPSFFLDLKCAAQPFVIAHKAHSHALSQEKDIHSPQQQCQACGLDLGNGNVYGCKGCKYNIHFRCIMLPLTVRHRWDEHHITLRFPPHYDLPDDDIMCDICEDPINPFHWLYLCLKCDFCFHPYCFSRFSEYPNIKFGGQLHINSHPHPLKFLQKATLKNNCDACQINLSGKNVFECETCYMCLCISCGSQESGSLSSKC